MNWYRSGNWNHAKFRSAIQWLLALAIWTVLAIFRGPVEASLYVGTFGAVGFVFYWFGHEDGRAQGLVDGKHEIDEHEKALQ